jgi:hypothetical protein
VQQAADTAKAVGVFGRVRQQFVGQVQHAFALDAGAQQQGQQFGVT